MTIRVTTQEQQDMRRVPSLQLQKLIRECLVIGSAEECVAYQKAVLAVVKTAQRGGWRLIRFDDDTVAYPSEAVFVVTTTPDHPVLFWMRFWEFDPEITVEG